MGRKGHKKGKKVAGNEDSDVFSNEELMSALFQPMAPNKRNELNGIVEKLLNLSSNYTQDDPSTPAKLFTEFEEIYALVQKIRSIETQGNMNRRLGSRKLHIKSFMEWLKKYGAKIEGKNTYLFQFKNIWLEKGRVLA